MDELVATLLSFPSYPPPQKPLTDQQYDEAITAHIKTVKSIPESKLIQLTTSGESLLDVIKPETHSVPYVYILIAHLNAGGKGNLALSGLQVYHKMCIFVGRGDSRQFRYIGKGVCTVVESLVDYANQYQPGTSIAPLSDYLRRHDPSGSVLTMTHVELAMAAAKSGNFAAAAQVLDKPILYFPGSSNLAKPKYLCDMSLPPTSYLTPATGLTTKLKPNLVLEYFVSSGIVYIGLRQWEKALESLENAVTYPAQEVAVSKIMVEAYKKWLLLSVLIDGKARPLPKSTSSAAAKEFHTLAKAYEAVAQTFESGPATRLKSEVEAGAQIWGRDFNDGLLLSILAAYQQFEIKNLGKVYNRVSIPEVHNMTVSAEIGGKLPSVQATESLVQGMIANGLLDATLSTAPNAPSILTFNTGVTVVSEAQVQRDLIASALRIQALTQEIEMTNKILTHHTDWIKYAAKQKKILRPDGSYDPNSYFERDIAEDEDLMDQGY